MDRENIIFLDCTRLDESDTLVSRINAIDFTSVDRQIELISSILKSTNQTRIILADDVVFSGSVLRTIIDKFKNNQIEVIGVRSCISTVESYYYFNNKLTLGLKCGFLLYEDIIDQICERDFYFGIVQSGISIKKQDKSIYKAPYFKPYGNPNERASIPKEYVKLFSNGCINRSLSLWYEIERLSKKLIFMKELPEKINETNDEDRVVKILKRDRGI